MLGGVWRQIFLNETTLYVINIGFELVYLLLEIVKDT